MDKFSIETVNSRGFVHIREYGYDSREANQAFRQCKMLGISAKMYRNSTLIAENKGV